MLEFALRRPKNGVLPDGRLPFQSMLIPALPMDAVTAEQKVVQSDVCKADAQCQNGEVNC